MTTARPANAERSFPVLVTGGAGFLGSALVRRLRADGHTIVVVDDGSGGTSHQLDRFAADPAIRLYRVDVRDLARLTEICHVERPRFVIHLAGRHFIPSCEQQPDETWQVNVDGTRTLLKALETHPPNCFSLASTGDVYQHASSPHTESSPVQPLSVYGRSKLVAEDLARRAGQRWTKRILIARLFNLYGPDHTVEHLVPAVITQALACDELELGDLTTVRDYVYVDDAAAAIIDLITSDASGTYNVGTGIPTAGADLVELVAKRLDERFQGVSGRRRAVIA